MFSLMDKVPSGIEPMLKDLEEHIMSAGLADMVASAETITSVSTCACILIQCGGVNGSVVLMSVNNSSLLSLTFRVF